MKKFLQVAEDESTMDTICELQNRVCLECPLDWACDERGVTCAAFDSLLDSAIERGEICITDDILESL